MEDPLIYQNQAAPHETRMASAQSLLKDIFVYLIEGGGYNEGEILMLCEDLLDEAFDQLDADH